MKGKWKTIRRMVDLNLIVLKITRKVNGLLERRQRDGVDERRAEQHGWLKPHHVDSYIRSTWTEHSSSGAQSVGSHMRRHRAYALKTKQERDGCVRQPVYPQQQQSASSRRHVSVWSCGTQHPMPRDSSPGRECCLATPLFWPVETDVTLLPPE